MSPTLGASVGVLAMVFPVAVLNNLVASRDDGAGSPLVLVFYALILLGGASGGWAVVRLSSRARLTHAAAAAASAYAIAQGIGVVLRLLRGDTLSWVAYPFLALMMACCGMLGGMFARRWQQQHGPADGPEGGN